MKSPWLFADALPADLFGELRQRVIFECCKWDPQVEDICTLLARPLVLSQDAWTELARSAEQLALETLAAEAELLADISLQASLKLPGNLRKAFDLAARKGPSAEAARVMRFDFHFTTDGWRISEVNSDVPGGFNEASGFSRLMLPHFPGCTLPGDPAGALADGIVAATDPGSTVALVHATAFTDDRQVMVYLARELESRGRQAVLTGPDHLRWRNGMAFVASDWHTGPVSLVFRFFPAEWLPNLPSVCDWLHFFTGAVTPLSNPATALLSQTKRFPLVWDKLKSPVSTWRRLLPETRDPRETPWQTDETWVLKPACGRVGEGIGIRGVTSEKEWQAIAKNVRRRPDDWVAQRRFQMTPLICGVDALFPCIGVFTVNGRAVGAYGRVARTPIVDHLAQDAAVLVKDSAQRMETPGSSFLFTHESIGAF